MYCTNCGKEMNDNDTYCLFCGKQVPAFFHEQENCSASTISLGKVSTEVSVNHDTIAPNTKQPSDRPVKGNNEFFVSTTEDEEYRNELGFYKNINPVVYEIVKRPPLQEINNKLNQNANQALMNGKLNSPLVRSIFYIVLFVLIFEAIVLAIINA